MPEQQPPQVIYSPQHPQGAVIPADFDFGRVVCHSLRRDNKGADTSVFRFYDYAIMQWVQGATIFDGRVIPAVFATPLRAYATYKELLGKGAVTPFEQPEDAQTDMAKFPLPFISIERGAHEPNRELQNSNWPIRNVAYMDADKLRTTYARYPKPLLIPYQIDMWAKYQRHMNWFDQILERQFWNPIAYWLAQTPFIDNFLLPIRRQQTTDNSDLERDEDRLLRHTWQVVVEAWMFDDVLQAPTFHTLKQTIHEGETELDTKVTKLTDEVADKLTFDETAALPSGAPMADVPS